ncbi:unnamed protein product [Protopolystoma xenopodis]|uniref:Uncharacterized protein n=1 Tax=Protopolystoma xenopodis TaxID=117903 RepID=A0A3S5B033_9PLAT|nr:unnamed protein product [Protopolystoma xenopodis]
MDIVVLTQLSLEMVNYELQLIASTEPVCGLHRNKIIALPSGLMYRRLVRAQSRSYRPHSQPGRVGSRDAGLLLLKPASKSLQSDTNDVESGILPCRLGIKHTCLP